MNNTTDERREDSRKSLKTVVFVNNGETPTTGYSRDLSISGLGLEIPQALQSGEKLQLTFMLPGESRVIRASAEVTRTTHSGTTCGIRFHTLDVEDEFDIECFIHSSGMRCAHS